MKAKKVTLKQVHLVSCPSCGVGPGEKCELTMGQARTEPHRDRRLAAAEVNAAPAKPDDQLTNHSAAMTKQGRAFDPKTFLTTIGIGREMMSFTKGQAIYSLNDAADALFVIQEGKVKLSVRPPAWEGSNPRHIECWSAFPHRLGQRSDALHPPANQEKDYAARPDKAPKASKYVLGIRVTEEHPISARVG